ncbi:zf-DHHC-domain-containing protein [Yamadazyma tenuis ATCC 10573]|uniref:Palmitoyltransferase n=3 Tax=Candida tenuis TaxID=2315449 RepID=G3BAM8_CANTC|nr:zf-DHHC-domain-containing protein [Yamadazyma tenuis ATCC 10573]EGV61446.1 zf-DHHC-domain-containing protein [Yamadazyma tenuis ATCC 10573]
MFKINSFNHGFMIPKLFLTGLMMVPIAYVLKNFVIKGIVPDRSLLKSPLSSGIFSGTLFWAILSFCFEVFPIVAFKSFRLFIHSLLLAACIVVISYSFYKSMVLNPGLVPITTDQTKIMAQIHELIKINRFNPDNFCVNMLVRKPLRSKYSHYNKRLIARFDHFCPWVYNEIGVRNHKIFIFFIYSLNLGIFLYSTLVLSYFKYAKPQLETRDGYDSDDEGECLFFDDEMCKGFINFNFTFNLMVWCCFQFVWVSFLSLTQTFQIVKGLTTYEFATLSSPGSLGEPKNPFKVCLKLLGIDQFMLSAKMSIMSLLNRNVDDFQNIESDIPSDYGVKQNWLDFWVLGDIKFRNVFYLPLEGENNLNGQLVDYYTLYDYPSKSPSQLA